MFLMSDLVDKAQGINQPIFVEKRPRVKQASLFFSYRGKDLPVTELAKIGGMQTQTLRLRLRKGWSVEAAVNTPLQARPTK